MFYFNILSQTAGYSTELKRDAIENYEYPNGKEWQRLFNEGIFTRNERSD